MTVQDLPIFSWVSSNLTVEATGPTGATVSYSAASAYDPLGGAVMLTYSTASGSLFGLGLTTVTVTAKNAAGNTTVATFTVTVWDTTPPVITTISPTITVTRTSSAGAVVSYAAATATDAVGSVTITYSQASGTTFAVGTTWVTVTATDTAGNVTTKKFKVIVL